MAAKSPASGVARATWRLPVDSQASASLLLAGKPNIDGVANDPAVLALIRPPDARASPVGHVDRAHTAPSRVQPPDAAASAGPRWCRPADRLISRWPALTRLLRYAGVSAVSTTMSLVVLVSLVATDSVSSGWANVIATAAGTIPSFELNRRWVWGRSGRRSLATEVVPFCTVSFLSLAISSLVVSQATAWASAAGFGNSLRAGIAVAANLSTFGAMWVAQYFLLDRVLFRGTE